jgi:hypothetical protein
MGAAREIFINGEDHSEAVDGFAQALGLAEIALGRCSSLLLAQMYCASALQRRMNPYKVVHELQALEGGSSPSRTKAPTQFKHPPLNGLWHKHYLADGIRSMAINLRLALMKHGLPHMQRMVDEATASGEERFLTDHDIGAITHDAVLGNWSRRSEVSALTGDWIIFAQHGGLNYYLCLASHETGDEFIRAQIDRVCVHEFPFLADLLCSIN